MCLLIIIRLIVRSNVSIFPYPGTIKMAKKRQDRIRNCQLVIDSLAKDILGIDLSHIFSHEIVDGDVITIRNLLEIYVGLLEYITEELQQENDQIATDNIQGKIRIHVISENCLMV